MGCDGGEKEGMKEGKKKGKIGNPFQLYQKEKCPCFLQIHSYIRRISVHSVDIQYTLGNLI